MNTVDQLSDHVYCSMNRDNDDLHERRVANITTRHWARQMRRATRRRKTVDQSAMNEYVCQMAKDEAVGTGILAFFAFEFLGWLVTKLLDALWRWWHAEPKSMQIVGVIGV